MPIKCETARVRTIWRYLKSTLAIFQLPRIFQIPASDLSAQKSCVLSFSSIYAIGLNRPNNPVATKERRINLHNNITKIMTHKTEVHHQENL